MNGEKLADMEAAVVSLPSPAPGEQSQQSLLDSTTMKTSSLFELELCRLNAFLEQVKMIKILTGMTSVLIFMIIGGSIGVMMGGLDGKEDNKDKARATSASEVRTWQEVVKSKPYDDLAGLKGVKDAFAQVLNPQKSLIHGNKRKPLKSILLFGPPGCGKTLIAETLSGHYHYNFLEVTGAKIVSNLLGQSAQNIRRYFAEALRNGPCVIFFDELETLLKKRGGEGRGRTEEDDRVVSEFLTEMNKVIDDMSAKVIVVGATNIPESLDDAALRRFHKRIYVPLPDASARKTMFQKRFPALSAAQLAELAELTFMRSAADISNCINTVFEKAEVEHRQKHPGAQGISEEDLEIPMDLIRDAARKSKSTVKKSTLIGYRDWAKSFGDVVEAEDPDKGTGRRRLSSYDLDDEERRIAERLKTPSGTDPGFESLIGMDLIKAELKSVVDVIVDQQEAIEQGLFTPNKGILLFGPPGTGKTALAKALAKESGTAQTPWNFLAVAPSDIIGSMQGQSEKNLNRFFRVAEAYQPCILFFDEIDGLFQDRSRDYTGMYTGLVNQFLQVMEGHDVDPARQLVVLAATNYPDRLDTAVLRRLGLRLYIPLPNTDARSKMFVKALTVNKTKPNVEALGNLVAESAGYSNSDIANVINTARRLEVAEQQARSKRKIKYDGLISDKCMAEAFKQTPPSAKSDLIRSNQDWGLKYGTVLEKEDFEAPSESFRDFVVDKVNGLYALAKGLLDTRAPDPT